jgi:MoxR-like ATPase
VASKICKTILDNIARVVVGKGETAELLLAALIAEGHVLLEDMPGVGKTLLAKALARSMGGSFKRIQFTPDLLPSDVTGFNALDRISGAFVFHPGPVMCNVLLADEINRTIPRTQASLLESMGERQVTVDGATMALPRPFFVVATQNPIDLEGTFPLPEAQLDRFLLRLRLGYPDEAEECSILERYSLSDPLETLEAVARPEDIVGLQEERSSVSVSAQVRLYISRLADATRRSPRLRLGASPRASLGLMKAAQALAVLADRDFVLPDDVKRLAVPVLAHRVIPREQELIRGASADELIAELVSTVAVPVLEP